MVCRTASYPRLSSLTAHDTSTGKRHQLLDRDHLEFGYYGDDSARFGPFGGSYGSTPLYLYDWGNACGILCFYATSGDSA